jgi:SPX domain protein involved in polyphosphate accumulation
VERKTHREKWTGDLSVKERFVVKESQIKSLLNGTFNVDGAIAIMLH